LNKKINGLLIVMLVAVAVKKQDLASIRQNSQTADNQMIAKAAKIK